MLCKVDCQYLTLIIIIHSTLALMVCVDLSKPEEIWFTLESLLTSARSKIEAAINDLKPEFPTIRETLQKRAMERIGEDHPDRNMLDPFPVPLIIIGTKYDLFQVGITLTKLLTH